jgi:hypothetical protein
MGTETNPYEPHQGTVMLKSKVYRRTFARNRIVDANEKDIPPMFRSDIKDISAEHEEMGCVDMEVPVIYPPKAPTGYAYLALIHDFQWHIVGYGSTDSVTLKFPAVGKNVIHQPVYYTDGSQHSAGYPFLVDSKGSTATFSADSPDTSLTFSIIKPDYDRPWFFRMLNGVFEGANKPDFSDAKVLHTVKKMPELYNRVRLSGKHSYRYVRYKSPENGCCNVAEVEFLGSSGKKLEGVHIGTTGSFASYGQTGDKAFDGNIATFYDAAEGSGAWTGLDLGEQQKITAIRYMPRVEGHGVYDGHEYELFCWDRDSWKSLDKQTAAGEAVAFRAPAAALFYIVNLTAQRKGKAFYVSGKQSIFLE